jgi:putative Ca2+/H+ antiporter (TMEM165/GDT1 family)
MRSSCAVVLIGLIDVVSASFSQAHGTRLPMATSQISALPVIRTHISPTAASRAALPAVTLAIKKEEEEEEEALSSVAEPRFEAPPLNVANFMPVAVAAATIIFTPASANAVSLASGAGQLGDSFAQALSLIFVSELGDKTFFIAALLAARASKLLTFAGCAGALAFMTAVSVVIGQVFHAVPSSLTRGLPIDDYVAIVSFLYFGVKSLLDAFSVEDDGAGISEERDEAEETLSGVDTTGGWPLVVEASTLTIAAEIGDRSQLATIALRCALSHAPTAAMRSRATRTRLRSATIALYLCRAQPARTCRRPIRLLTRTPLRRPCAARPAFTQCGRQSVWSIPRWHGGALHCDGDGGPWRLLHLQIPLRTRHRHRRRRPLPRVRRYHRCRSPVRWSNPAQLCLLA